MAAPLDRGLPPDPGHEMEGDHPRLVLAAGVKTFAQDQTPTLAIHTWTGPSPGVFH